MPLYHRWHRKRFVSATPDNNMKRIFSHRSIPFHQVRHSTTDPPILYQERRKARKKWKLQRCWPGLFLQFLLQRLHQSRALHSIMQPVRIRDRPSLWWLEIRRVGSLLVMSFGGFPLLTWLLYFYFVSLHCSIFWYGSRWRRCWQDYLRTSRWCRPEDGRELRKWPKLIPLFGNRRLHLALERSALSIRGYAGTDAFILSWIRLQHPNFHLFATTLSPSSALCVQERKDLDMKDLRFTGMSVYIWKSTEDPENFVAAAITTTRN